MSVWVRSRNDHAYVDDVLSRGVCESSRTDRSPAIDFPNKRIEVDEISDILESGRSFSSDLLVELSLDFCCGLGVEYRGQNDDLDR